MKIYLYASFVLILTGCVLPADYVMHVEGVAPSNTDCFVRYKGANETLYTTESVSSDFNFTYVSNSIYGRQSLTLICDGKVIDSKIDIVSSEVGTRENPVELQRKHNKPLKQDK